jgi:hypothetical protein
MGSFIEAYVTNARMLKQRKLLERKKRSIKGFYLICSILETTKIAIK